MTLEESSLLNSLKQWYVEHNHVPLEMSSPLYAQLDSLGIVSFIIWIQESNPELVLFDFDLLIDLSPEEVSRSLVQSLATA